MKRAESKEDSTKAKLDDGDILFDKGLDKAELDSEGILEKEDKAVLDKEGIFDKDKFFFPHHLKKG
jgi:hypothetical protein